MTERPKKGIAWLVKKAPIVQAIVSLVMLGSFVWAVVRYGSVAEDQKKAKHYLAWQVISDAQGKSGSGGRRMALEDLHGDGVRLLGVDLSGGAYLGYLNLTGADLMKANLEGAILIGANLQETRLRGANLQGAILVAANLQGANLTGAKLQGADLRMANLSTSRGLTREQVLSTRDWRGAVLPSDLKDLELPEDSLEEELNRLGRTWKTVEE